MKEFFQRSKDDDDEIQIVEHRCEKHKKPPAFWCYICSIVICEICMRNDHRSHVFGTLDILSLLDMIHCRFGDDVFSFLTTRRNEIEESFTKVSSEIEALTSAQVARKNVVEDLEKKRALVNLCLERLTKDVGKKQLDLLLTVLKMDVGISVQTDTVKCSVGTQTEPTCENVSLFGKIFRVVVNTILIILNIFLIVFYFSHELVKKIGNFWRNFLNDLGSEKFSNLCPFPLRIKQRDPLSFYDFSVHYSCFKISLQPKITKKNRHEKMLSIWIEIQRTTDNQIGHNRNMPIYVVLINPEDPLQFIRKRTELKPSARRQQLVEMLPYSDLITTHQHWERNGCFFAFLEFDA